MFLTLSDCWWDDDEWDDDEDDLGSLYIKIVEMNMHNWTLTFDCYTEYCLIDNLNIFNIHIFNILIILIFLIKKNNVEYQEVSFL